MFKTWVEVRLTSVPRQQQAVKSEPTHSHTHLDTHTHPHAHAHGHAHALAQALTLPSYNSSLVDFERVWCMK